MIRVFKRLYLSDWFFILFGGIAILFAISFGWPMWFPVAKTLLLLGLALTIADLFILFHPRLKISCKRQVPKIFSLGDQNEVRLIIQNHFNAPINVEIIDELPEQFQKRDFRLRVRLSANEKQYIPYELRPVIRGEYHFKQVHVFVFSFLFMAQKRLTFDEPDMVAVYPSVVQMKQYELKALARISHYQGIKKIRRLGHSYEFEQIKNYVRGDDYRSINWKATSRQNNLMVNQYEDERAQQVYCIIDKSRAMRLPFEELSLMDHAINTSLVISNIALKKHDKAGLITFSEKLGQTVKAERKLNQLRKIMESLYHQKPGKLEANYELLFLGVKRFVKGRSLLLLYTNFESYYALERALPILRKINRLHLLVVVFFLNTEVEDYSQEESKTVEEIYFRTIAQKFVSEKYQMVQTLKQYGIQSILTRPEQLSINTINKYLELKARGLI